MTFDIEKIFEDVDYLSRVHSKKEYESYSRAFMSDRYYLLEDLISEDDVQTQSQLFCEDVYSSFKKFGKVRGRDQMNLNYFMIYYLFPNLLKEENGKEICDTLKDEWNQKFKCNISYTDYDSLMEGFQTKIFGIPIGKN